MCKDDLVLYEIFLPDSAWIGDGELYATDPGRYGPLLAESLRNVSSLLTELGRPSTAAELLSRADKVSNRQSSTASPTQSPRRQLGVRSMACAIVPGLLGNE